MTVSSGVEAMAEAGQTDTERAVAALGGALAAGTLTISALEDGSGVVIDINGEQLLEMNATGLAMMEAIADGQTDPDAVCTQVAERFDAPVERVRGDFSTFVGEVCRSVGLSAG